MKIIFVLLLTLLISIACSKKDESAGLKYTTEEFDKLAHAASSVNPVGVNAIPFFDYSPGVNKANSKTLVVERLKFYAVEFESEILAHDEAVRLNQYYSRNYLFDRVEGEPLLEDYIIETFKAKNPNKTMQRSPKKSEGHGEHGAHSPPAEHSEHATTHQ
jgi:hypothetical protein